VQRIRFLNPAVESEVQRALDVLARGHDTQRKAVSLHFNGTGKRAVRVGYVVEAPLWRTSYRLLVDKEGKLFVQGWALVENPTNEDWKDVGMGLVSGRPISFKMDLYQPLYVPRPTVTPELHGAVKPVVHQGAMNEQLGTPATAQAPTAPQYELTPSATFAMPPAEAAPQPKRGQSEEFGVEIGLQPAVTAQPAVTNSGPFVNIERPAVIDATAFQKAKNRSAINLQNGIISASAKESGDSFEYLIDQPVSIPRQKSALLPIVNKALEGDKVSVYNASAHPKYPLLALRLKNTTGVYLMQGPVAVFEGNGYCGDTQMPDLQPNEMRLVSYALDLGTEVQAINAAPERQLVSLKLHKGTLHMTLKVRESQTYTIKNRNQHDRLVVVEHPYRPDYKLLTKEEPKERGQTVYRFEVKVPAGKTAKLEVAEGQESNSAASLVHVDGSLLRYLLECELDNADVKTALDNALARLDQRQATSQEMAQVQQQLAEITGDQQRLRANLKEMPQTAKAYSRYLEKFDAQETAIEKLQTSLEQLRNQANKQETELQRYWEGLDLETAVQSSPPLPPQLR
jgi:hypothetical protein